MKPPNRSDPAVLGFDKKSKTAGSRPRTPPYSEHCAKLVPFKMFGWHQFSRIRDEPYDMIPNLRHPTLLLFILLFMAGCDQQPQLRPLATDARILAFGDSLTYGTGTTREQSYPAVLQGLLQREVINAGIPGEVSAAGRERLPQLLQREQPQLVILTHGGNDFLRRLDLQATKANLQTMIDSCRQSGAEVVLVGVPQFGLFLSPAPFYAELTEANGLPYLDETLSDILSDRDLKSDTIHPNAKGYRLLAEALAELIKDAQN